MTFSKIVRSAIVAGAGTALVLGTGMVASARTSGSVANAQAASTSMERFDAAAADQAAEAQAEAAEQAAEAQAEAAEQAAEAQAEAAEAQAEAAEDTDEDADEDTDEDTDEDDAVEATPVKPGVVTTVAPTREESREAPEAESHEHGGDNHEGHDD